MLINEAWAQTVDDTAKLDAQIALAKKCKEAGDAAVRIAQCSAFQAPTMIQAQPNAGGSRSKGSKAAAESARIEVLSAWGTKAEPKAEVLINSQYRIMALGESHAGWTLTALDRYSAEFTPRKGSAQTIHYRSAPPPPKNGDVFDASQAGAGATGQGQGQIPPGRPMPMPSSLIQPGAPINTAPLGPMPSVSTNSAK
ncbi:MAG: hypothetical protein QM533_05195 [Cytophagales bacterium]|nr:hypothetical protein [Cytophagales bacterium]